MPQLPPRACATCGRLGCPAHRRPARQHGSPLARRAGRRLQAERFRLYVDATGSCAGCHRLLTFDEAIRDHIRPLAEGGADDDANVQLLCPQCHDLKSAAEAKRGVYRAW